jgi:hypothetical protein
MYLISIKLHFNYLTENASQYCDYRFKDKM